MQELIEAIGAAAVAIGAVIGILKGLAVKLGDPDQNTLKDLWKMIKG